MALGYKIHDILSKIPNLVTRSYWREVTVISTSSYKNVHCHTFHSTCIARGDFSHFLQEWYFPAVKIDSMLFFLRSAPVNRCNGFWDNWSGASEAFFSCTYADFLVSNPLCFRSIMSWTNNIVKVADCWLKLWYLENFHKIFGTLSLIFITSIKSLIHAWGM